MRERKHSDFVLKLFNTISWFLILFLFTLLKEMSLNPYLSMLKVTIFNFLSHLTLV